MRKNKTVHAIVIAALLGATVLTTAINPDAGPIPVVSAVTPIADQALVVQKSAGEDTGAPLNRYCCSAGAAAAGSSNFSTPRGTTSTWMCAVTSRCRRTSTSCRPALLIG